MRTCVRRCCGCREKSGIEGPIGRASTAARAPCSLTNASRSSTRSRAGNPFTAPTAGWCCRQRRDLQPPRTAARAGRRVRLPHRFGLRGDPPALPQIRRGAARPAQRHLRLRALRHRARRVPHRPRPRRRHSALHRLGCRRTVLRRIGVEGARRGVQRHPPLRAGAAIGWSREGKTTRWYTRDWFDYEAVEQATPTLPRCARRSKRPSDGS